MPIKLPSNYSGYNTQSRGIQESQYDLNVPIESTPEEYRGLRQSKIASFGNMLGRGTMGALAGIDETMAAVGDWGGIYNRITGAEDDYTNWLAEGAQKMRDWSEEAMPEYHSKSFGDFGWWMQNGSSVVETLGYAVTGGAIGEGLGVGLKGLGMTGNALRYSKGISAAITMNYTEGVQIASQSYKQMIEDGVSREEASKAASRLIDLNRLNLAFDIPQYLSLFKLKNTDFSRAFKNIDSNKFTKGARELGYQMFNEGSEEILQGYFQNETERQAKLNDATRILQDPTATKTQKQRAKDVLQSTDLDSTGMSRFLNYATSEEGLTSGIFGALGGGLFQGAAAIKSKIQGTEPSQLNRESEARSQIEANTASLQNLVKKNGIIDETELNEALNSNDEVKRDLAINKKFANIAFTNAERGTYKQFLNTLEQIQSTTKEEAEEFSIDYEYLKKKAPKFIEDAKLIEKLYNDVQVNFRDVKIDPSNPLDTEALNKLKVDALNVKYNYKMYNDFAKEAQNKRNEAYSKHADPNERMILEKKHELEALKNVSKVNKDIAERVKKEKEIEFLQTQLNGYIDLFNSDKSTKKHQDDFVNPLIDDEAISDWEKQITYDWAKDKSVETYKDLVKKKQEAFDTTKESLKEQVEEQAKKEEVKQTTEKETKAKAEQAEKASKAKPKQKEKPKSKTIVQETGEESIVQDEPTSLDDILNSVAKANQNTEEQVKSKDNELSGEEAYNPMPEEYESELIEQEEELEDTEDQAEIPGLGSSVFSLAYNLIEYNKTKSGRFKTTGEPDINADERLFDPNFLSEGEEVIIYIDNKHPDYDTHKDDLNNVPIAVIKKDDYNQGNENPFAYIHRTEWYEKNQNIEEENRQLLAEETRAFRNKLFQNRGQNGAVIPYSIMIIDKSIGRLNLVNEQHSVFSIEDDPQIVVAKTSQSVIGNTREYNDLIGSLKRGVPYLLIETPNKKTFPKYLKTYKLGETKQSQDIVDSIYNLLDEYFKTQGESPKLAEAKIKDFRDLADEIKKFVYFGDKTVDLDIRKQFFADVTTGYVSIQGQTYDFNEEVDTESFKKALKNLYIGVNSKHLEDKNQSKFSYLTYKDGKFVRNYTPYKKFLDQAGFITINAKANYGTIFGNYVTKIDSSSLKPFEESIVEEKVQPMVDKDTLAKQDRNHRKEKSLERGVLEPFSSNNDELDQFKGFYYKLVNDLEVIQPVFGETKEVVLDKINSLYEGEIVAKSEEKPYIDSTKKHGFKRATKQNIVDDKTAEKRKKDCL